MSLKTKSAVFEYHEKRKATAKFRYQVCRVIDLTLVYPHSDF